jgi:Fe-Mn family superoxide dismutase
MFAPRTVSIRLRQCIRQPAILRQSRSVHAVLNLPYEDIDPSVNGIYPLYSAEGFKVAWTDRQKYLVDQVNRITTGINLKAWLNVGTAIAHEDLFNLVVLTAQQPDMAPLFNYSSSAWNNAFFFMGIVSPQKLN